jgi:hypothetical protein
VIFDGSSPTAPICPNTGFSLAFDIVSGTAVEGRRSSSSTPRYRDLVERSGRRHGPGLGGPIAWC